jgi:hypothetical protein
MQALGSIARADEQIARGERIISDQEALIARMRAREFDTDEARQTLSLMRQSLQLMREYRQLLVNWLDWCKPSG